MLTCALPESHGTFFLCAYIVQVNLVGFIVYCSLDATATLGLTRAIVGANQNGLIL